MLVFPFNMVLDKNVQQIMSALVTLTENIRKDLDKGNVCHGIFVESIYLVKYDILLLKLEHYSIHGLANDWLKSYP